jgi:hypothetical protein
MVGLSRSNQGIKMESDAKKMLSRNSKYRYRYANKKTGHLSSSTTWQINLAGIANTYGLACGIGVLLPLSKAKKMEQANELRPFKVQAHPYHDNERVAARNALPTIKEIFDVIGGRRGKKTTAEYLSEWISSELRNTTSKLSKALMASEHSACIDINHEPQWWRDQMAAEKKQSKLKKSRVSPM